MMVNGLILFIQVGLLALLVLLADHPIAHSGWSPGTGLPRKGSGASDRTRCGQSVCHGLAVRCRLRPERQKQSAFRGTGRDRCPDHQSKNRDSSTGGDAGDQHINRQCGLSGLFPGGSGRCGVLAIQPFRTAHVESLRRHYCQRVYLAACLFAVSSTQSVPRATGSA